MKKSESERLIGIVTRFVENREDLRAVALCGSWARGNAREDSDLDILIVARDPRKFRRVEKWIEELRFDEAGFSYAGHETATYGVAWSAHVELSPMAEVELTFVNPSWSEMHPVDESTRHVVSDAFEILVDKDALLSPLLRLRSG